MNRFLQSIITALVSILCITSVPRAQMEGLHGDDSETRMGVHSGNQFRTTFYNDGTYGAIAPKTPDEIIGEWPINSGHYFLVDGNIFVGSEVTSNSGQLIHILSENKSYNLENSAGDKDPNTGAWWTFLPLRGFADPAGTRIAMAKGNSEWPGSWPSFWPDKMKDATDPGWRNDNVDGNTGKAAWNGYFGKNVFNADEESYFVADDYMNREFISEFLPDERDPSRGGLGLRIYVRGFQWAKSLVEDALFVLYDVEHIGTKPHDKMIFSYKIGNNMGEDNTGQDLNDDNASFLKEENGKTYNLAFMTDNDDRGASGWQVGYFGGAFLESPGNPYDGIDNDNDGKSGTGEPITESMFNRGVLSLDGPPIILINYSDPAFPRGNPTTLRDALTAAGKSVNDTLELNYGSRIYKFWAGKELIENGDNLVDDNLNGLIDESRGQPDAAGILRYLYVGYISKNFFTGSGLNNPMLDERRDDGIDNDGDWDPEFDDVGADGIGPGARDYPGPDFGEKDGIPTNGEPHFDKTDIDESDQLGLTSVNLYEWSGANNQQYNDEGYWNLMVPGIFSLPQQALNVELLFGSGYFPLVPQQIERISMGIICGLTRGELLNTTQNVALAYHSNYNFSKAPDIPKVHAVAGDNKVILFWDDRAERSEDPITGDPSSSDPRIRSDFEGYRIYRSTDPGFNDGGYISEARFGTKLWSKPIAQFDYANEVFGFSLTPEQGVQYWLGDDTGLKHYWIDTTAVNGTTYYYAVTSYDRGSIPLDPATAMRSPTLSDTMHISPSECTKFVAVLSTGEIEKGQNVVVVRPEAPVAGYVAAQLSPAGIKPGNTNTASGSVKFNIVDPAAIKENHTYRITFKDTTSGAGVNTSKRTQSYSLLDVTESENETILLDEPLPAENDEQYILVGKTGFNLVFSGNPAKLENDTINSGWSRGGVFYGPAGSGIRPYRLTPYSQGRKPIELLPDNIEIIFSDPGVDTSKEYNRSTSGSVQMLPAVPVNFMVMQRGKQLDFAFRENHITPGDTGRFSASESLSDEIIILAPWSQNPDSIVASWQIRVFPAEGSDTELPVNGDILYLKFNRPFLANDSYEFTTLQSDVNNESAKTEMDKIRVVPNPYIVSNAWEPKNPYADGRGERELHFTHLPPKCTVRIFNVRGQLVNTLEHDSGINLQGELTPAYSGTLTWNMLSKDNLEISYGIYIYHIDAPGIGEKIGKFIVIK